MWRRLSERAASSGTGGRPERSSPAAGGTRRRAGLRLVAAGGVAASLLGLMLLAKAAIADATVATIAAPAPAVAAVPGDPAEAGEAAAVARALASRLAAARAVVSAHQDLINDPARGDKGFTAAVVLAETDERQKAQGTAATTGGRAARLLALLDLAIEDVLDQSQDTINAEGVGFKGFIPAVFARLVTTRFNSLAGGEAQMRVTAPLALVRNRSSRPDAWESEMIATYLSSPAWTRGTAIEAAAVAADRPAFRLLIPEYYAASCLSCHGKPAGEIDRTGYPKEGASEGDLGGVISVTLW